MNGNTGWFYNKKYFGKLQGIASNGNLLHSYNNILIELPYEEFCLKQLVDQQDKLKSAKGPYCEFELWTCYPGLITGIGVNHQTTIQWINTNNKNVPEYKLGMHFDHTTGMPIIPGSSVKGALRTYFPIPNQKGVCDNYEEKCQYIASILDRITEVENMTKIKDEIIRKKLQEKLVVYYKENVQQSQLLEANSIERIKEIKEYQLLILSDAKKISQEKFKELESVIDQIVENKINTHNSIVLEKFYSKNRDLKKTKKRFEEKINDDFDNFIKEQLYSPLSSNDSSDWIDKIPRIALEIFEGIQSDGQRLSSYSKDVFFDAIPTKGDPDGKLFEKDYITPHNNALRDPNPICFMKIRPNVRFQFYFKLHNGILTKAQKLSLFEYLLRDNGLGAKTNIGYGQFR